MNEVITLSQELLRCGSNQESNKKVQKLLTESISSCAPRTEIIEAGGNQNTFSLVGSSGPLLLFQGHSDVVSVGEESEWTHPPFAGVVKDGVLYGRGAVDMRAANAAFCVALRKTWKDLKDKIQIGLVITGDEETKALGAPAVIEHIKKRALEPKLCLVGEPSGLHATADRIRIGRRGSLSATVKFEGQQGHVAYLGSNANVLNIALAASSELCKVKWPKDAKPWPEVNFHITNFSSGTGEINVIPSSAEFKFNVRFGPSLDKQKVKSVCEQILEEAVVGTKVSFSASWSRGAEVFFTDDNNLINLISSSVEKVINIMPTQEVDGGTSDGRFFAASGIPTIEVGTKASSLHEVNEQIPVAELETLVDVYSQILLDFAANS